MRWSNFSAPAAEVSVSVSIDSIGTAWRTGRSPSRTAPITPRRRRLVAAQLGMRGLDRLQLLEQRVVVGVRDRRRIEDVVRMRVAGQDGAQLGGAVRRLGIGRLRPRRGHGSARRREPATAARVLAAPERHEVGPAVLQRRVAQRHERRRRQREWRRHVAEGA
jgi:hypothetical protein